MRHPEVHLQRVPPLHDGEQRLDEALPRERLGRRLRAARRGADARDPVQDAARVRADPRPAPVVARVRCVERVDDRLLRGQRRPRREEVGVGHRPLRHLVGVHRAPGELLAPQVRPLLLRGGKAHHLDGLRGRRGRAGHCVLLSIGVCGDPQ